MSTLKQAIAIAAQANIPILIMSEPGVGKTSYVNWLKDQFGWWLYALIGSIASNTDFGWPIPKGDRVVIVPPDWAIELCEHPKSILFLDELPTCPPAIQAAMLKIVHEHRVGPLQLPANLSIIAAGNPPELCPGGWDISPALANRFLHLEWQMHDVHKREWMQGVIAGDFSIPVHKLPSGWEKGLPAVRAQIASFGRARPDCIHELPEDPTRACGAWPSPRTWYEMAAPAIAACNSLGLLGVDEISVMLLQGSIGEGAACEFMSWQENMDLPDPEEVLRAGAKFKFPERQDKIYAICASIASAVIAEPTVERYAAAWDVLGRVAELEMADLAVTAALALAAHRPEGAPLVQKGASKLVPLFKEAGLIT